jgi:long-chain acyl-CoA synthetase
MVIGEHEKFASALISPNFKYFDDWKRSNIISFSNNEELIQQLVVQQFFSNEMLNKKLSPSERLNRLTCSGRMDTGNRELSPTLNLATIYPG